ncbi:MAG: Uma2 family endonuclease [Polyangiaceae bacterium]|nr:Uma2 family endonuclease [Polyangiaceae bacterium]
MNVEPRLTRRPVPIAPSEERWRQMTKEEREQFIVSVNEALSDPLITMSEGRPHKKAKSRAIDMLGLHFRAMGRKIYLAEEMSVIYPETAGFTPDVLAVLDVEEPADDQRMAWVVQDEGKGLDWVLEVLWAGDRKKDLVENVERYATLGIPEYFIYDQKQQRLLGYRLSPELKRYQPILPQSGLYRSSVLGIDLAIVEGSLRFYQGAAELYDTAHLIRRLQGMVANLETRAQEAADEAEKNRMTIREAILALLATRGITCTEAALEQLNGCIDADVLKRWLSRAMTASSEADVFSPV